VAPRRNQGLGGGGGPPGGGPVKRNSFLFHGKGAPFPLGPARGTNAGGRGGGAFGVGPNTGRAGSKKMNQGLGKCPLFPRLPNKGSIFPRGGAPRPTRIPRFPGRVGGNQGGGKPPPLNRRGQSRLHFGGGGRAEKKKKRKKKKKKEKGGGENPRKGGARGGARFLYRTGAGGAVFPGGDSNPPGFGAAPPGAPVAGHRAQGAGSTGKNPHPRRGGAGDARGAPPPSGALPKTPPANFPPLRPGFLQRQGFWGAGGGGRPGRHFPASLGKKPGQPSAPGAGAVGPQAFPTGAAPGRQLPGAAGPTPATFQFFQRGQLPGAPGPAQPRGAGQTLPPGGPLGISPQWLTFNGPLRPGGAGKGGGLWGAGWGPGRLQGSPGRMGPGAGDWQNFEQKGSSHKGAPAAFAWGPGWPPWKTREKPGETKQGGAGFPQPSLSSAGTRQGGFSGRGPASEWGPAETPGSRGPLPAGPI